MAILGIDEVGRGPWAGPLVIGAVILLDEKPEWVAELNDSKKLTAKKREKLNEIILKEAPATGLGWVTSAELDQLGLSEALKLAARRAVEEVQKKKVPFTEIIIDGTINFLQGTKLENYVSVLPKADFLIKEVSAASIIAKVARDNYMTNLAEKYPQYGFEKHVGYGTAAHKKALEEFGPCPEHRFSFKPVAQLCPPASVFEKLPDSEEYKRSAAGVEMPDGISTPRVTLEEASELASPIPTISLSDKAYKDTWQVVRTDEGKFIVTGEKIEKFARRTDLGNYASVNRLRDIMKKLGIKAELTSLGAEPESIISIAGKEFTLVEDY